MDSSKKDSFLKARDKTLERVGAALFTRLIGDNSLCLCELYETKDLQYEHDILIIKNRHLYIIEAKASEDRVHLHGKVFGTDELEYAGFFIKNGSLSELRQADADIIVLPPNYSDIFDDIYLASKFGERVTVNVTEPVFTNIRDELLAESRSKRRNNNDSNKRNDEKKRKRKKK